MKPWVLPASTSLAALAGAVTIIVVWLMKIGANVEVPDYVAQAFTLIVSVAVGHFTVDTPTPEVAQAAVDKIVEKTKGD